LDDRGHESGIPYSSRGGYAGPQAGYLERRGDGVYLVVRGGGNTVVPYGPGTFLVARPYGTNIEPRAGTRDTAGHWTIEPEPVLVDYVTGYAGKPIVIGTCRVLEDDTLDSPSDPDRVAARFTALSRPPGTELGSVLVELCANGTGDITITATGNVTLNASGMVHLGGDPADDFVALATSVRAEVTTLRDYVATLVLPVATTGTAAAQTGTAGPPAVPPAVVGSVAASKVKAT